MGLLDQVTGALGGALGGAKGGAKSGGVNAILLQQLVAMLGKPGALGNLTSAFQQNGLGNILQSWIGTGQNLPISGEQVQQVLGAGTLGEIASKAGIGAPEAATALSGLLPQVVDKISPDGKSPGATDIGGLLGKFLG